MIKKDIILSEQDIGSFFYSFLKREYKSDSDLQNYTRRKGLYAMKVMTSFGYEIMLPRGFWFQTLDVNNHGVKYRRTA